MTGFKFFLIWWSKQASGQLRMRVDFTEREQLMAKLSDISVIGVF